MRDFGIKDGSPYVKKFSYCGPGTDLKKRLDENGNPKAGYEPINGLDTACLAHDKAYQEHKDTESRNKADAVLLDQANAWENSGVKLRLADKLNLRIVKKIMSKKVKDGI